MSLTVWTYDWVPEGPRGFVRDVRLRWALEEAGLDYDVRSVPFENRGAEHFEATCAECHGPAATAPTLRGVIGRPIASVESFFGYSEALKAMNGQKWTAEKIDAYIKSPDTFAPGNLMYRDYPDAQMRADVIAFIASLPPPKN